MQKEIVLVIEKALREKTGRPVTVLHGRPVGGGCINSTYKCETTAGSFFVKLNDAARYPGMFKAEEKGLMMMRQTHTVTVPEVIGSGECEDQAFLILQWIESARRRPDFFENFAIRLAAMHRHSSTLYGLDHDNYIGSLPQVNTRCSGFEEFFICYRLEAQLKEAINHQRLPKSIHRQFEKLYKRLSEIIPPEKPAFIHGDLWSGNYMTGADGYVCLIDPAVYYGHRESDIAMSLLFGGFDQTFYDTYNRHFPMEKGWQQRAEVLNLYPLLVHVNLFGGGYTSQVMQIVKRF